MLKLLIELLILAGFSLFFSIKVLKKHERGVVFTFGRFTRVKGPGLALLIPFCPTHGKGRSQHAHS